MHCKGGDKRSQKDEEKGIERSSWEIFTTLHNVKAREEAWRGKSKIVATELNKMVQAKMQVCTDLTYLSII